MYSMKDLTICLLGLSLAADVSFSQERDRSRIPNDCKWNLADIYPSDEAWKAAKLKFLNQFPHIATWKGKLGTSATNLASCFEEMNELGKSYARLSIYASMSSDLDTREGIPQAMVQEMGQIGSEFNAQTSYIQPEILAIGRTMIDRWMETEPRLRIFAHDLDDILRRHEHTGTQLEEKIIADAGLMADTPDNIFGIFSNADFPYPDVKLADGTALHLDKATFFLYRQVPNREDRQKIFSAFFGTLHHYSRTFGTQLYAEVKKDLFYKKARNYPSCLAAALDGSNIPLAVYTNLVEGVNNNLATFHRYLRLRARMLGVSPLHYYDLYAPIVKSVDLSYPYDEAKKHVLASLAILGNEYIATSTRALSERWVDVYPNTGKRSGAYSQGGVYDVHPFMLLNYNGKYDDVSTLTHELGHTLHSYYSNAAQPYNLSQYSIFVAEVASTFNEALLIEHLLTTTHDDNVRLSMLGNYLDNIRSTVFRQTQFAEFELAIHEMVESGQTLTGDVLDSLYLGITRKYYGHDKGMCVVDDFVKAEWSNVPHFYYNFYVYQYATSFTASAAISEKVLAGDRTATDRYLNLLRAGGSDYPITLLKQAGVDMTTSEPLALTMKKMNRIMDEMEQILDRQQR